MLNLYMNELIFRRWQHPARWKLKLFYVQYQVKHSSLQHRHYFIVNGNRTEWKAWSRWQCRAWRWTIVAVPNLHQTLLCNMATKNAAELKKKHELAMIFHAQVNEFRFFPLRFIKRIFNSVIGLVVERWPGFFLWKDSS